LGGHDRILEVSDRLQKFCRSGTAQADEYGHAEQDGGVDSRLLPGDLVLLPRPADKVGAFYYARLIQRADGIGRGFFRWRLNIGLDESEASATAGGVSDQTGDGGIVHGCFPLFGGLQKFCRYGLSKGLLLCGTALAPSA
jgi:hypothetical protein